MSRLVSPNELLEAAQQEMLGGADPQSREDWLLIVNFLAVNIDASVVKPAIYLMTRIYSMPIELEDIDEIVAFHAKWRPRCEDAPCCGHGGNCGEPLC